MNEVETWDLPNCEFRKFRTLVKKEYNPVTLDKTYDTVIFEEHWTSSHPDNKGCYLIEVIRVEKNGYKLR